MAPRQTCVGDQMGWQVDAFHVQQEGGGLYVPLLHRVIPDNQYCIEDFHTNGSLATMVSHGRGRQETGNGSLTHRRRGES